MKSKYRKWRRALSGLALVGSLAAAPAAWAEGDPVFLNNRATRLLNAGDVDGAIADLNEAIRLDPKLAAAYANRGLIYAQRRDQARAMADYDAALALGAGKSAYTNRGNLFMSMGQHERAVADYQAALKLQPLASLTLINLAIAYREMGRYEESLRAADHSYRLKTEPRAQVVRGDTLLLMGDYAAAESAYTKAIVTVRKYTEAYRDRAYARLKLGKYDLAMEDADKAVELEPGRPDVLNNRCWLRAIAGRDLQQAAADCDAALANAPTNAGIFHTRAYARLRAGDVSGASADLERADALQPDAPDVLFLRGAIKLRSGNEADARADITRALKLNPIVHRDYDGLALPAWASAP